MELSREEKEQLYLLLKEKEERIKNNYIDTLFQDRGPILDGCLNPISREFYPKHIEFLNAGADYTERAFIAGNRTGKSLTGLYELVTHCTGKYPKWWKGKRFSKPVQCWLAGDRGEIIRDSLQKDLLGRDGIGTGMIPKDLLISTSALQGTPNGIGTYLIKHVTGGTSQIVVKTYQSGKDAFEAAKIDVCMLDEECPLIIYIECLMRVMTTGGTVYLTFTPDSGLTDTVLHFLEKPKPGEQERFVRMVSWNDVPHLSETSKKSLIATIPPHLLEVKTKGIPYLGSGAIYPVPESDIVIKPFNIPDYWPKAYGFDPGWNKTAGIWGAYEESSDTWYLYSEYYRSQAETEVHVSAIKARGEWISGVVDPHGSKTGRGVNSESFLDAYERQGLNLMLSYPAGPGSVDLGINEVYSRLSSGRLKIFSSLVNWLYEYRMYRRDDKGKIVLVNNHLMDATRYLMLSGIDVMTTEPENIRPRKKYINHDNSISNITGY